MNKIFFRNQLEILIKIIPLHQIYKHRNIVYIYGNFNSTT